MNDLGRFERRWMLAGLAAALALSSGAVRAQVPAKPPLTIFAAASLTNALTDVARAYTARTGQWVRFSFAASGIAARQLEAGASADLFFSAEPEWMDHVQARGLIAAGSRRDILRGRLALIAPKASTLSLRITRGFPLATALGARGRLATGDPDYVPAGRYARAALQSLGVWPSVAGRIVRADNVRVALAYVARGEAPLGVVYETDAAVDPGVRIVDVFPANSHPPVVYPIAVLRHAGPGASNFAAFVRGPAARAIFIRYRFQPL